MTKRVAMKWSLYLINWKGFAVFNLKSSFLALAVIVLSAMETYAVFEGINFNLNATINESDENSLYVRYHLVRKRQGDFRERIIASSETICVRNGLNHKKLFENIQLSDGEIYHVYRTYWAGNNNLYEGYNLVEGGEISTLTTTADLTAVLNSLYIYSDNLKVENRSEASLMDVGPDSEIP